MRETTIAIDGMHCGGCVRRVTEALKAVEGVEVKDVQVGKARVLWDGTQAVLERIASTIQKLGFVSKGELG